MATQLREAPELPELPESGSSRAVVPQGGMHAPSLPFASGAAGLGGGSGVGSLGRQLRRMLTLVAGGGLILALVLLLFQAVAKPGLRPTDLLAAFETQYELGLIAGKTGGDPAHPAMTEPEYQRMIAEAQREGAAQAEARLQEKIIALQTDQQRIVGAYSTLYQRTNIVAQAAMQMEAAMLQARQQAVAAGQGGKTASAGIHDMLCELGNAPSCERARAIRRENVEEMNELAGTGQGQTLRDLMGDMPDPASLVAGAVPATKDSGLRVRAPTFGMGAAKP